MEADVQKPTYTHDVFVSYSRKDEEFASKLEQALENYKPPKGFKVPRRNLDIFRDKKDFTGVDDPQALATHLQESAKLLVICSPNARKSTFVTDEIRRFAKTNGADNIIPLLLSGIPNNEATREQDDEKAFPEALCEFMAMPLAASYVGFDFRKDKVNRSPFGDAWYKIISKNKGMRSGHDEQRNKRRQIRNRNLSRAEWKQYLGDI